MSTINQNQTNESAIAKRIPAIRATETNEGFIFNFANGQSLTAILSQLSVEMQAKCALHGLKQKLVDSAAINRDDKTGKSATPAEKAQAVMMTWERLLEGQWNADKVGGGGSSYLLQALCVVHPKTPEEVLVKWIAKLTDEAKKALVKSPKIAVEIAKLQTANSKTSLGDDLLAELEELASEE